MNEEKWPSLPAMLFAQAAKFGGKPFVWTKRDSGWVPTSWAEITRDVTRLARALRDLGIESGDRVAIIAEGSPQWIVADFAVMAAGGISVPAYTTSTVDDYRHVLANSGAKGLILSNDALARRVLPAANQIASLRFVVSFEPLHQQSSTDCDLWDDILARGAALTSDIAAISDRLQLDDTACIIHTSGTGGVPKGVMLTHRNILSNCRGVGQILGELRQGKEIFLSFLPLNHAYEHMAGVMFPVSIGAEIYLSRGADTLAAEMLEVRPTIVTAVPRLFETLHRRITTAMERQGGTTLRLFRRTLALGSKRDRAPKSLTLFERLVDACLTRLVRAKIAKRFGGRLVAFVSGGAPLNPEIGLFFKALGVTLLQGYGQTEASPVVCINPFNRVRIGTVGPPLTDIDLKIAEDGEILVRGPCVMKGYWNDPEATARTIRDGWLHTGDVGETDPDGYLRITDRKRDFIKNAGGEMIAPARVEGFLTFQHGIAQALVYGDQRPYLTALIVPDEALIREAAGGGDVAALVHQRLAAAVEAANAMLAPAERIRRYAVTLEPFTVENGQMTPTLKLRRREILQAYGAVLNGLYERGG